MKLLHRHAESLVFHLDVNEKRLFEDLLGHYPVLRTNYQPLSKGSLSTADQAAANQQLLEESLGALKAENQGKLRQFMGQPRRFEREKGGYRLSLPTAEIEWLLQVINDIRVGHWYRAGCPDVPEGETAMPPVKNLPSFLAMELAGFFQWQILKAFQTDIS